MSTLWSDGRYRSTDPQLYAAIRQYWDDYNNEEITRLRWENIWMREQMTLPPEPWEQIKRDKEQLQQLVKEIGT